jgi:V/A-type H+-transporting ATPase subunit D
LSSPLNKTFLAEEQRRLRNYEQYLPALDLKRKQLLIALAGERAQLTELRSQRAQLESDVGERLPMLANDRLDLSGLVEVESVELAAQNLLGSRLPVLEHISLRRRPYGWLMLPHWVDVVADRLSQVLRLEVEISVASERVARLERAARTLTQRVNLFEKVLIPEARSNLRRIQIFLADSARYAAIRAKIAKSKSAMLHHDAEAQGQVGG